MIGSYTNETDNKVAVRTDIVATVRPGRGLLSLFLEVRVSLKCPAGKNRVPF